VIDSYVKAVCLTLTSHAPGSYHAINSNISPVIFNILLARTRSLTASL